MAWVYVVVYQRVDHIHLSHCVCDANKIRNNNNMDQTCEWRNHHDSNHMHYILYYHNSNANPWINNDDHSIVCSGSRWRTILFAAFACTTIEPFQSLIGPHTKAYYCDHRGCDRHCDDHPPYITVVLQCHHRHPAAYCGDMMMANLWHMTWCEQRKPYTKAVQCSTKLKLFTKLQIIEQ